MKPTAFAGAVALALPLLVPARAEAVSPEEFVNKAAISDMFESGSSQLAANNSNSEHVGQASNDPARVALRGTMSRFTVEKGKHYRAKISLGPLQSNASNGTVADKFREVGFTNVAVTGSGRTRHARGLWPHDDAAAEIPSEIIWIE